ncbi:MAG: FAD-binding protein [Clostridia bacterium]|nr:FAD-binding protein [Clostridia bacterium]
MKKVLIIGRGISGLSCAIRCAQHGIRVTLAAPFPSERAQSVMAAGGINAVTSEHEEGDSLERHVEDTLKGGGYLAGKRAVSGLCEHAQEIINYLEKIGTVFSLDENSRPMKRAFGGQSYKRTHYCGASTGKQIVSSLAMEARRYEASGLITRRRSWFHSALIADGVCHGAILFDENDGKLEAVYADAVVMATGGQNALFGKTTGSALCDGYAAGRLFMQGAVLKNLEFIQYHPTTLETPQKRMLISEAARGEGGRLFYEEDSARRYFMEEKYGPRGNLMTRDVISREIDAAGHPVFLDVSFLDGKIIDERLPEVRDLCRKYRGIDIHTDPIPVEPSVHFFMGGLAVHLDHETSVRNLFAVGECASMYHGANRLGGNSLLAAIYSAKVAADAISQREDQKGHPDLEKTVCEEQNKLESSKDSQSRFPVMYIRDMLSQTMCGRLGIVRSEENLSKGLEDVDYYLSIAKKINYDRSVMPYYNYSLTGILTLAKATLLCANARKESRGAHFRSDFNKTEECFAHATLISYDEGKFSVSQDMENEYES